MRTLAGGALTALGLAVAFVAAAMLAGPLVGGSRTEVPSASAPGSPASPIWLHIPAIEVEVPVVEVSVLNGEYEVPPSAAGHHADSAMPGVPGNVVINGHRVYDRVFARLHLLRPGDRVTVRSPGGETHWQVAESLLVPREEAWYIAPTAETRLTLYTCEGPWDWAAFDQSLRRVVIALPLAAAKPVRESIIRI